MKTYKHADDVYDIKELKIDYSINGGVAKGGNLACFCPNPDHEDNKGSFNVWVLPNTATATYGVGNCLVCGDYAKNVFSLYGYNIASAPTDFDKLAERVLNILHPPEDDEFTLPATRTMFIEDFRGISSETYAKHDAFLSSWCDETYRINGGVAKRIWFPIYNDDGTVRFIHGRLLKDSKISSVMAQKYHNAPKGKKKDYYPNNPEADENGVLYLVEGFFDYLALYDAGVKNVVCIFGTGKGVNFSNLDAETLVLALDNDKNESGQKAAKALRKRLREEFIVRNLTLPVGEDPASIGKEKIAEYFR